MKFSFLIYFIVIVPVFSTIPPEGYRDVLWGTSLVEVQQAFEGKTFRKITPQDMQFPENVPLSCFAIDDVVAGYPAKTEFYFFEERFFQVLIRFDFDRLKTYDVNYNVFISVDRYYTEIRATTLLFVADIYELLYQKYGRKEPTFRTLDPRFCFVETDKYLAQERWNLRYKPSEYYKCIVAQSYAEWRFPKTEIRFAVALSASEQRFDYTLSLVSLDLLSEVQGEIQSIREADL